MRTLHLNSFSGLLLLAAACTEHSPVSVAQPINPPAAITHQAIRVYRNPYRDVNWGTDIALMTQLHDHVGSSASGLRAYDSAGYDVMSLMTYSGVASMSYAWHERHWPPDAWISPAVLGSFAHIKFFI